MRKRPLLEKFLEKIKKSDDGCWLWTAHRLAAGYGVIGNGGKLIKAHRAAWMLFRGPIPEGMLVCHKCDNPPCCNPDHLFIGTSHDNNMDCLRKGRAILPKNRARGEKCATSKFMASQVMEIKKMKGRCSARSLARKYNVHHSSIMNIWKEITWTHVSV